MKKPKIIIIILISSLISVLLASHICYRVKDNKTDQIKTEYETKLQEMNQENIDLNYKIEYLENGEMQDTFNSIMVVYPTKVKIGSEFDFQVMISFSKTSMKKEKFNYYLQAYSSNMDKSFTEEAVIHEEELESGLYYGGGVNNIFTFENDSYIYNRRIHREEVSSMMQENLQDIPTFGYTIHVKMTDEKIDFSQVNFGQFRIELNTVESLGWGSSGFAPFIRIEYFTIDDENLILSTDFFKRSTDEYVDPGSDVAAAIAPPRYGYNSCLFEVCYFAPTMLPTDLTKGTSAFTSSDAYAYLDNYNTDDYQSGVLFHNLTGDVQCLNTKTLVTYDLEENSYGSIVQYLEFNNGGKQRFKTISVAKKNGIIYSSEELSEEELCKQLNIPYQSFVEKTLVEENLQKASPKLKVNGYIKWTDSFGNLWNAKNQKVEVYDVVGANEYYLGTATTNSNGYYSYSKNIVSEDTFNIRIKIVLGNSQYFIDDGHNNPYNISSDITYNVGNNTVSKSITAGSLSLDSDRLYIITNLKYYSDYAKDVLGYYLPQIKVDYNRNNNARFENNVIYYDSTCTVMPDYIGHEYGHYFAAYTNISNNTSVYGHTLYSLHCSLCGDCEVGHLSAWNEGLVGFFVSCANSVKGDSFLDAERLYIGNSLYSESFNLDNFPEGLKIGPGNELVNAALLFNIADPTNSVLGDNIVWGYNETLLYLINNNVVSLNTFFNALNNNASFNDIMAISKIMTDYQISSKITNVSEGINGLYISWNVQDCENVSNHFFTVHIYDEDGIEITLNYETLNTNITISRNDWLMIKSIAGDKIYITVETNSFEIIEPKYSEFRTYLIN